jgi:hypothetical protein
LSNLNENNNNNIPNNNNNGNRLSENLEISYWQSELNRSSINEQPNRESQKAGQSFIDKYSKFLWFSNKNHGDMTLQSKFVLQFICIDICVKQRSPLLAQQFFFLFAVSTHYNL